MRTYSQIDYQDKVVKLSAEQEQSWTKTMAEFKSNIKDLDSSPGFGEKLSNFFSEAIFMAAVFGGVAAAAGATILGIGAGISGASSAMVDTMGMAGAIAGPALLGAGVLLSVMFDERKERNEREKLISQFPKIIDSDEKADSILKAGFGNADNIVDFTKSENGLKKLVDAVGSDETAQILISSARNIIELEILGDVNRTQQHWQI